MSSIGAHPSRPPTASPAAAGEVLAELGDCVCPSLASMLERLIDRQARDIAQRGQP